MATWNLNKFLLLFMAAIIIQAWVKLPADAIESEDDTPQITRQVLDLMRNAVLKKNFSGLEAFVSDNALVSWAPCQGSDVLSEPVTFAEFQRLIAKYSGESSIIVNEHVWMKGRDSVAVETSGWENDPLTFIYFWFGNKDGRLNFGGACIRKTREEEFELYLEEIGAIRRPDVSSSSEVQTFYARIKRATDSYVRASELKRFTANPEFNVIPCTEDMIKPGVMGRREPVTDFIDYLAKHHPKNFGNLKYWYSEGPFRYLEIAGWAGGYPYIYFGFTKAEKGWEWTRVVYFEYSPPFLPKK
jgi:hypothetical protein